MENADVIELEAVANTIRGMLMDPRLATEIRDAALDLPGRIDKITEKFTD